MPGYSSGGAGSSERPGASRINGYSWLPPFPVFGQGSGEVRSCHVTTPRAAGPPVCVLWSVSEPLAVAVHVQGVDATRTCSMRGGCMHTPSQQQELPACCHARGVRRRRSLRAGLCVPQTGAGATAAAPEQGAAGSAALAATISTDSGSQPWDVPATRPLMPGDSLATIEAARTRTALPPPVLARL